MATTVILGSGIIGLSTAYYLSQHQPGSSIHLVDASSELFASASGFAGGFLANDWFQPVVASLGALSFEEHRRLAEEHEGRGRWGYSKSVSLSYEPGRLGPNDEHGEEGLPDVAGEETTEQLEDIEIPSWLRRSSGDALSVIDDGNQTAIVDPLRLCRFLLEKCTEVGVHVHHPATALAVATDVQGELASVRIGYTDSSTEIEIPATRLLISAGAWTPQVFASLFQSSEVEIPIDSLAGHSLVVKTPGGAGEICHSVYCSVGARSVELFSRTNGVIYLAGVNSPKATLPGLATGAIPEGASVEELKRIARQLIASDGDLEVVRTGLCFRPMTSLGVPILARLTDEQLGGAVSTRPGQEGGVFVAAGHGVWGIALSLGTGRVMADLMQGREPSANISRLGM